MTPNHRPNPKAARARAGDPPRIHAPLAAVLVAVIVGIVVDRRLPMMVEVWWTVALVGLLAWLIFRRLQIRFEASLAKPWDRPLPRRWRRVVGRAIRTANGRFWSDIAPRFPVLLQCKPHCEIVSRSLAALFSRRPLASRIGRDPDSSFASLMRPLATAALLVCVASTAGAWHHLRWHLVRQDEVGLAAEDVKLPICVRAVVADDPFFDPAGPQDPMNMLPPRDRLVLEIEPIAVRDGRTWRSASGRARLSVYFDEPSVSSKGIAATLRRGDTIELFAQFARPSPARNPGSFDARRHGRVHGRLTEMSTNAAECVSVLHHGQVGPWRRTIDSIRRRGHEILQRHLDEENQDIAAAMLLGIRDTLDPEEYDRWRETGTVHLLAISGLHLGILAGALIFLALRLPVPRVVSLSAVVLIVLAYMVIVDARPPIVRATSLVMVTCLGMVVARRGLSLNTVAAAGLVVLAVNPCQLFQVGTQLSFLAVAAIIQFSAPWTMAAGRAIESRLGDSDGGWIFRRSFLWLIKGFAAALMVSTAIWLVSLPLIAGQFHIATPISIPLNAILWLPMTATLLSGFLTLLFGAFVPVLGDLFGGICNLSLGSMQALVDAGSRVPGGYFWVAGPAPWWILGFYLALIVLFIYPTVRWPTTRKMAVLIGWVAVGLTVAAIGHRGAGLSCRFVSVGHGCGVIVDLPDGRTLLYDAGSLGPPRYTADAISSALWSHGTTHIDAVVISHPDLDHYSALPSLLDRFSVGVVYVPRTMFFESTPALDLLREAIEASGTPVRYVRAGDRLAHDPRAESDDANTCLIEVLHPPSRRVYASDNAGSVVLLLQYQGRRVLLPGDIEGIGIADLVAELPIPCDVVMAPHHGSRQSNPTGFCEWSSPRHVVISGREPSDDRLVAVEAAYRDAGAKVYRTFDSGLIAFELRRESVRVMPTLNAQARGW